MQSGVSFRVVHRVRPYSSGTKKFQFSVRLLVDARVVDVPISSNPIVVTPPSWKPFFVNGLQYGGVLHGPWRSIRPWNPIRASWHSRSRARPRRALSAAPPPPDCAGAAGAATACAARLSLAPRKPGSAHPG